MKDKGKRHTLFRIQKILLTFHNCLTILKGPATQKTQILDVVSDSPPTFQIMTAMKNQIVLNLTFAVELH